jgi:hypothetical protein
MVPDFSYNFLPWGPEDMAAFLRHFPNEINKHDSEGFTLLVVASLNPHISPEFTTWLIDEMGADVNFETEWGVPPLHLAATPEVVSLLIERGAAVGMHANQGTPLLSLVHKGHVECVERMLMDPRVVETAHIQHPPPCCYDGCTVLHLAFKTSYIRKKKGRREMAKTLCTYAAPDPFVLSAKGETALDLLRRLREGGEDEDMGGDDDFYYEDEGAEEEEDHLDGLEEQILESHRVYLLTKVRRLNEASLAITKAKEQVEKEGRATRAVVKRLVGAKTPPYLQERVERGGPPLPRMEVSDLAAAGGGDEGEKEKREKLLAVFDFVVQGEGRLVKEGGGGGGGGGAAAAPAPAPAAACLSPDVFADLMMMLSSWHPMREERAGGDV